MATQKFTSFDVCLFVCFSISQAKFYLSQTLLHHTSVTEAAGYSLHIYVLLVFLIKNNSSDLDTWLSCFNPHPPLSWVTTPWMGNINGRVPLFSDASVRCLLSQIRCIPFSLPLPLLYLPPGMWVGDWGSSRYFEPQEQELLKGMVE